MESVLTMRQLCQQQHLQLVQNQQRRFIQMLPPYRHNISKIEKSISSNIGLRNIRGICCTSYANVEVNEMLFTGVQAVHRLCAVVLHDGNSPSSGHHSTITLHNGQWYNCSDLSAEEAHDASGEVYLTLYTAEGTLNSCGLCMTVIDTLLLPLLTVNY